MSNSFWLYDRKEVNNKEEKLNKSLNEEQHTETEGFPLEVTFSGAELARLYSGDSEFYTS